MSQIATQPVRLVAPDGSDIAMPASVFEALEALAQAMSDALTVSLIPHVEE